MRSFQELVDTFGDFWAIIILGESFGEDFWKKQDNGLVVAIYKHIIYSKDEKLTGMTSALMKELITRHKDNPGELIKLLCIAKNAEDIIFAGQIENVLIELSSKKFSLANACVAWFLCREGDAKDKLEKIVDKLISFDAVCEIFADSSNEEFRFSLALKVLGIAESVSNWMYLLLNEDRLGLGSSKDLILSRLDGHEDLRAETWFNAFDYWKNNHIDDCSAIEAIFAKKFELLEADFRAWEKCYGKLHLCLKQVAIKKMLKVAVKPVDQVFVWLEAKKLESDGAMKGDEVSKKAFSLIQRDRHAFATWMNLVENLRCADDEWIGLYSPEYYGYIDTLRWLCFQELLRLADSFDEMFEVFSLDTAFVNLWINLFKMARTFEQCNRLFEWKRSNADAALTRELLNTMYEKAEDQKEWGELYCAFRKMGSEWDEKAEHCIQKVLEFPNTFDGTVYVVEKLIDEGVFDKLLNESLTNLEVVDAPFEEWHKLYCRRESRLEVRSAATTKLLEIVYRKIKLSACSFNELKQLRFFAIEGDRAEILSSMINVADFCQCLEVYELAVGNEKLMDNLSERLLYQAGGDIKKIHTIAHFFSNKKQYKLCNKAIERLRERL